jgi:hypothetical protein
VIRPHSWWRVRSFSNRKKKLLKQFLLALLPVETIVVLE